MKAGKIIFWTLLGGLAITSGILIYRKLSVKDAKKQADDLAEKAKANPGNMQLQKDAAEAKVTAAASTVAPAGFPLQRGSNNSLVKKMQEGLIANYGAGSTLPKYGADGIFGSETETALTNHGFPKVISQTDYNKIVAGQSVNGTAIRPGASSSNQGIMVNNGAFQVGEEGANIKFY